MTLVYLILINNNSFYCIRPNKKEENNVKQYKMLKIFKNSPLVVELKNNLINDEFCCGIRSNLPLKTFCILKSISLAILYFKILKNFIFNYNKKNYR